MALSFRDSLDGEVRPLAIPTGRPLTMYVCGPTVYDAAHVGHGRTYLYFDLVRRALRERGVVTRTVRNITDYEEKISLRARDLGLSWRALARREERQFRADMARLRLLPFDEEPRASRFVPRMIQVARRLVRTGRVEKRGNSWIYCPPPPDGRNFPEGDDFKAHTVPEPGHPAEDEGDRAREIVLWTNQESPFATWSSPWGRGAPGWHLECYAMAERYLGIPVDFHGGGMDLLFPHHYAENEIALALDGTLFARRFLHTGFVTQLHRKMAKSRGNLVPLRSALDQFGPDGLRWYLLGTPYHGRLEWETTRAERASSEWEEVRARLREVVRPGASGALVAKRLERLPDRVRARIEGGLDAVGALEELRTYAAEIGAAGSAHLALGDAGRGRRALRRIESMLGFAILEEPARLRSATGRGDRGSG
ncbi:MAG: class I tRNA ligase family protein [Thermoplasmata archaeon]